MDGNSYRCLGSILEDSISNILLKNGNGLKIEVNKRFTFSGGFYVADFFLPKGCEPLKIKPKTAIEVKYRLLFDTIDRVCARVAKTKDVKNLIIIYQEKLIGVSTDVEVQYDNLNVIIESYTEFEKRKQNLSEETNVSNCIHPTKTNKIQDLTNVSEKINIKEAFGDFRTTLILGAGVSISAGAADWTTLLKNIIEDSSQTPLNGDCFDEIKKYCCDSSLILGRFLMEPWRSNDGKFDKHVLDLIRNCIYPPGANDSSALIIEISKLVKRYQKDPLASIESIITYNYDDRIENALIKLGIKCYSVFGNNTPEAKSIPIYHVHGILPQDERKGYVFPVLSEESYHQLYKKTYNWTTIQTLHALMRNTCLLIGFSMSDPNLRRLLEFAAAESDGEPRHYIYLKREVLRNKSNQKELEKRQERIMRQFGLNVIWFDEFDELPNKIREI